MGQDKDWLWYICWVPDQTLCREGDSSSSVENNQIGERKVSFFMVLVCCLCGP